MWSPTVEPYSVTSHWSPQCSTWAPHNGVSTQYSTESGPSGVVESRCEALRELQASLMLRREVYTAKEIILVLTMEPHTGADTGASHWNPTLEHPVGAPQWSPTVEPCIGVHTECHTLELHSRATAQYSTQSGLCGIFGKPW